VYDFSRHIVFILHYALVGAINLLRNLMVQNNWRMNYSFIDAQTSLQHSD
jgi:hypothetical protein